MSDSLRVHPVLGLLGWMGLCTLTSVVGALASVSAPAFYAELVQPSWAPPAWLFGPAWTLLFLLMSVAAWRVWRLPNSPARTRALRWFVVQLVANALWSWLFFAWRLGGLALAELVLFWLLIAVTAWSFWRLDRWAGVLLLPYLAWVAFAGALNAVLWLSNPTLL
jgi:tryptophan-rich sensory protein